MSLPNNFDTAYDYFKQTIKFLAENSWIYKESNTCFLKNGILKTMPMEYQEYFAQIDNEELNQFPYIHQPLKNLKIQSLINFRQKLAALIPEEAFKEPTEFKTQIKFENFKKMNLKKQHEIQRLAKAVEENLKLYDANEDGLMEEHCVIDFGSGLGYLSEILYKLNKNLLILGLESDLQRVKAAEQRVQMYMPNASDAIQYRHQFITENSKDFIEQTLQELFKSNYHQIPAAEAAATTQRKISKGKSAIIGLHACADLTITSMKLFFQMPDVRHLIIMPCCYHKLKMYKGEDADDSTLKFINFPLSESLKQVFVENDNANYAAAAAAAAPTTSFLNRPFLRLACQQTLKRWSKCSQEEHITHGREMFLRAVAESLKQHNNEEEIELVVIKRKDVQINEATLSSGDEDQAFAAFCGLYGLKTRTGNIFVAWKEHHRVKFAEIMKQYPNGFALAEGLTCLQTSMQKLCENLVLCDRLCYMKETAVTLNLNINVRYEKLMDEELSPRCYALIAEKL